MYTRIFKAYGAEGHRIKESFSTSHSFETERDGEKLNVSVLCSDVTGHNDFVLVVITGDSQEKIFEEIDGQITDGIFENQNVGNVQVLSNGKMTALSDVVRCYDAVSSDEFDPCNIIRICDYVNARAVVNDLDPVFEWTLENKWVDIESGEVIQDGREALDYALDLNSEATDYHGLLFKD